MADELIALVSANGVTLLAFVLFLIADQPVQRHVSADWQPRLRGLMLALLGPGLMLFHVHGAHGAIFDQRGAGLALATLFGGVGSGAAAAAMELFTRLWLGGPATAAGCVGIAVDFLLCALLVLIPAKRGHPVREGWRLLLVVGGAIGLSEAFSLLLVMPPQVGWSLFTHDGLVLGVAQMVSTILFGGLMNLQARSRRAEASLRLQDEAQALGLTHAGTDFLMKLDAEGRIIDVNPPYAARLGYNIQTPAEILTRPRALLREEMDLVKRHAQTGHDIVKDIDFGAPVAEMILQHHEHFDGNGYPQGLRGEAIMLEARIIHVADAVDAMLSHRPYRRAHDLDYVLAELATKAGKQFDPAIADACLKLLRERSLQDQDASRSIAS